jgi:hypothetical protein
MISASVGDMFFIVFAHPPVWPAAFSPNGKTWKCTGAGRRHWHGIDIRPMNGSVMPQLPSYMRPAYRHSN